MDKTQLNQIKKQYTLICPKDVENFLDENDMGIEILNAITPHVKKLFPESNYSLEVCDDLCWTTETKLLLNIPVDESMFFNGMLDNFNDIYSNIEPLIEKIICPIVLFPEIKNYNEYKTKENSAINLIARMAYFNNDFEQNELREVTLREIPKSQQEDEIIEYCKIHENPDISDIVYDLRLDLFDVDDIIDELEEKGIQLNVRYYEVLI